MDIFSLSVAYTRRRFITYKNHNEPVVKLLDAQHVQGALYKGRTQDSDGDTMYCKLFLYYSEYGIGVDMGWLYSNQTLDFAHITMLSTPQGMVEHLLSLAENGAFISKAQIMLAQYIRPEIADTLIAAREERERKRDEADRLEAERSQKEYLELAVRQNGKSQYIVDEAVEKILSGDRCRIVNSELTRYSGENMEKESTTMLFLHLARQYSVSIPLRTQGWINSKLNSVTYVDGKAVSLSHSGKSSGSKVIFDYLDLISDAICGTREVAA